MIALARAVVKYRYFVIALWTAIGIIAVPRAAHVNDVLQLEGRSLRPTESAAADSIMRTELARPLASFLAVAVTGPATIDDAPYREVLRELTDLAASQPYIDQVVSFLNTQDSGFVSADRRSTFFVVPFRAGDADSSTDLVPVFREAMRDGALSIRGARNYEILVTGQPALDHDARSVTAEDAKTAERRSLIPAGGVLVLAFGALVAAVLPLIVGLFAISTSLAAVQIAAQFHPMSVFVLTIITMVGLAVGIDYSLLVVTRFREELNHGLGPREAAVRSILTAGRAVITSGLTVMVGFASLLLTPIMETRSVGIGGLLVVSVAVILATTLLPAGLAILGRAIDWPKWLARRLTWYHTPTAWERWARWLSHHPVRALAIGLVIIGAITWPLGQIKIGLPTRGWFPEGTESTLGAEAIERIGSRGALLPLRITAQAPIGERVVSSRYVRGLKRLSDTLKADPRIARVRGPVDIGQPMSVLRYSLLYSDLESARESYPAFFESYVSLDGRTVMMDAALTDSTSFAGAMDVVRRLREIVAGGVRGLDSVSIQVGGFAASSLDLQEDLLSGFPIVVGLVLAITAIMLLIAFQSVLVPLKAVVMNCLSVAGAFGLLVLVFQEGVGVGLFGLSGPTEAVYVVVPVLVFAVVFGLSMDYEVFLLSRVKEAFDRTHKNDVATMEGLSVTASVITSAAAIMIIVFGTFAFSRVLAAKLMGFGLAVAVLLDATLIRMVLVPAFMHIAGRWNWWPGVRVPATPED